MHAEQHYLAGLDLAGRRVVVVGGGVVAQRRLPRLQSAGAAIEVVAPAVSAAVQAMAEAGELTWTRRAYAEGDLAGAWYVIACTSDAAVNAAVGAEAERQRVFCVRADLAADGSAVTPAVGSYEGLVFGVLAGGAYRRSAGVRDAVLAALRDGRVDDQGAAAATAEVASAGDETLPGVALIGGGPGDPELITVRGRRLLSRADVVVVDRLAPRELLDELPPEVEVIDAAKIPYGRAASQDVINTTLIEHARAGRFVVRLKGGDPYVFGRGFEEVLACAQAGVPVTVVPGITSAFAVPAIADVPVTHRGVTHEVVVVSGHVAPDDPSSLVDWAALGRLRGTIVLMMGVERLSQFAEVLQRHGRGADTPVAVVQDGTRRTQHTLRSTLAKVAADAAAADIKPPAVIVIGAVAALGESVT
ncbi:uroporphyrin-III C-methyltransferase/precorrin-2 dehydrogenase/sirohydrochlorin ferrochelatase [Tamaricihabitans halophyticus]|uniref:Uroporphyrin-III C-methyltransferase/precorrin-2 dehydrogenase/sirohydrochlorin ferrochelatase n=1 Tax=Tamaricihabitans halophyticus TaxID=1262583 RepID=A0A4R2QMZ9_9PSEU|nr:uroporphyrinogen-III C-methyltransferase [Tamaricihabitans halophyticus]TCP50817.1 uroporphyrin-III C-methyltransferase/precorrin-2 dehydrogenase/sirohydrochlorin ferrochelatase [Tamaricihabitans halophyticus]